MDLEHILNIQEIKKLNIEVMFGAVPKYLIGDISKKYNKRKTKNLFYIIFGIYLKETNRYIIFSSLFKTLKKKNTEGNWFLQTVVDSTVFNEKQEVLDYIYNFIDDFTEHERIINEEIMQIGVLPAEQVFEYLVLWNKGIFDYFNSYIEYENNKKKYRLFDKFRIK